MFLNNIKNLENKKRKTLFIMLIQNMKHSYLRSSEIREICITDMYIIQIEN